MALRMNSVTGETFKEELTPILHKLFRKIEEEIILPNSFAEASITLKSRPKMSQENFILLFLVNITQKSTMKYYQTESTIILKGLYIITK